MDDTLRSRAFAAGINPDEKMSKVVDTCEHGTARARCLECAAASTRPPVTNDLDFQRVFQWCPIAKASARHRVTAQGPVCIHCEELAAELVTGQSPDVLTDQEPFDLTQIPFEALKRLGTIFREGDRKYGNRIWSEDGKTLSTAPGNWKNGAGNVRYQLERANHALKHLMIYVHWLETREYLGEEAYDEEPVRHQKREDDLAKVMWFCVTQMELERLERCSSGQLSLP